MLRQIGCSFPLSTGEECTEKLRLIQANGAGDVLPKVFSNALHDCIAFVSAGAWMLLCSMSPLT